MVTRPSPTHIFSLLNFNPLVLNVIHIFRLNTSLSCVGDTRWNDRTTVSSKLYSKSWSTPTNYVDFSTFSSTELLWNIRFIYSTLYQWTTCRDILISIKKKFIFKNRFGCKMQKKFRVSGYEKWHILFWKLSISCDGSKFLYVNSFDGTQYFFQFFSSLNRWNIHQRNQ